jgi:transcriptional regulator with XRE-family HTH domain
MKKKELADFLSKLCKDKGLSLRSLSKNAGLSPSTVHSIINRGHEPSLYSLNQLADYLGVKRPYLWRLAGLLGDEDLADRDNNQDPRMSYYLDKLSLLPDSAKELLIHIIDDIVSYHAELQKYTTSNNND